MWRLKKFPFRTQEGATHAREKLNAWLEKRAERIQWREIFVNNAYAVEWRRLSKSA